MALVLGTDVSLSVDAREFSLQTGGIAWALTQPNVVSALLAAPGGVALTFFQWSDRTEQHVSVPWHLLRTHADIEAFATKMRKVPRAFGSKTAPGSALAFAKDLHEDAPFDCLAQVTDLSGDGIANSGQDTQNVSRAMVSAGHTINGLAILGDDPRLVPFYRHNVTGGPGHFLEIADGFEDYGRAMRDKLLRELPQNLAESPFR